ncbi:MAG TPA: SufE family protein [Actinomycetes bacterium]|nr:SufE family protein [Actinomycetes bacterium]
MSGVGLPAGLEAVVEEFSDTPAELRLEALLDYAERVPPLPPHLPREALERVHECQTPFFVAVEPTAEGTVRLYFDAPPEAPTTRGFAGILLAGLDGASVQEVLDTPGDFSTRLGLAEVISPLRLRGMGAILARIKRQLRAAPQAAGRPPAAPPG